MTLTDATNPYGVDGFRSLRIEGLDSLFRPRSIAVFGASSHLEKIGGRPLRFLKESGFQGGIYPINPKYEEVQGLRSYPSLAAIEEDVDLALIALPRDFVMGAIEACAEKGVGVAIIFSAGFAEAEADGAALQAHIAEFARAHDMRILGPNCLGSANHLTGAMATFAAVEGVPKPDFRWDKVAFVSQSGAIAAHCIIAALERGLDFDPWVSTGNESDIEFADCLAHLALDDDVKVIAAYMEGCRNGDKLREALAIAYEKKKPVIILKVGSSEVGAKAAASHTASLVGSDQIFDALFKEYNVCRVDSMAELIDTAYAFSLGKLPDGDRMGLLTGSGGVGIIMADAAAEFGMNVPPLPEAAQRGLKELWPAAGVGNPVDTTAQVMNDPNLLTAFLETVLRDGDFDMVVTFLTYMGILPPWADNVVGSLRAAREKFPDAHLVVSLLATPERLREVEELNILVFEDPSIALKTASRLVEVSAGFANPRKGSRFQPGQPSPALAGNASITEVEAKKILGEAGIPVVEERVVTSADEARAVAAELGFPVVMKVVSPQIIHKTEAGGVKLGLQSGDAAADAYEEIMASVTAKVPDADVEGILVAPMINDGVETILGVKNDPIFGPTVMFGLGGVFVEVLRDVTYRLAPFDRDVAEEMVREIKGFPMLDGARGSEPCDIDALSEALSALSIFAANNRDRIESIDINPFLVRPRGKGAIAVDALISRAE